MKITPVINYSKPKSLKEQNNTNKITFKRSDLILSEAIHHYRRGSEYYRSYPIWDNIDILKKQQNKVVKKLRILGTKAYHSLSENDKALLKLKTEHNFIVRVFEDDEAKAVKLLNRSKNFGINEYKKLTKKDKEHLKKITNPSFTDYNDVWWMTKFSAYRSNTMGIGKAYSKKLDELYPQGYTFLSVGRSPSLLGKYLEFEGKDVKYCPFSGFASSSEESFSEELVKTYKEYFDSLGLTKESIEIRKKPIVITDFKDTGATLRNFEKLLSSPEIGIVNGDKVHFRPMNNDSWSFNQETRKGIFSNPYEHNREYPYDDVQYALSSGMSSYKTYVPIPGFYPNSKDQPSLKELMDNHEQDIDCKKMLFCIANHLEQQGKLA